MRSQVKALGVCPRAPQAQGFIAHTTSLHPCQSRVTVTVVSCPLIPLHSGLLNTRVNAVMVSALQSLDLTTRKMIHEGPLTWRISKDKTLGMCQGLEMGGDLW